MRKHKITVFNETAEILGVGQVGLSESGELLADAIVIATGATPRKLPYRLRERSYLVCEGGDDAAVSAKAPVDCWSRRYRR